MKHLGSFSILALLVISYAAFNFYSVQEDSEKTSEIKQQFQAWTKEFSKDYANEAEKIYRMSIYLKNVQKINEHNAKKDKTYETGINQFTDLTEEQFKSIYLTLIPKVSELRIDEPRLKPVQKNVKAGEVNWVEKGFVTSIKDEGACGACWAFAALGPLQAMVKQQGKPLVSLSAQQLMDCSGSYGNYGCSGGYMTYAYKYIADKGVTTDSSYPYKGAYQKCAFDGGEYTIKGFKEMKDCTAIANALYNIPIAVAVDASKFYNYKSGVFSDCSPSPQLNHAFALVGLTNDYWLGKEQWGLKFGENGYIRIAKAGSACGICQMASYPF